MLRTEMEIEAALDRVREEYAHRGYLDAKVDPVQPRMMTKRTPVSSGVKVEGGSNIGSARWCSHGISTAAGTPPPRAWPIPSGESFDKTKYEGVF